MDHFCNLVAGIFPYFCIEQMIKEYGSYLSALLMPEIVGILMISKEPDF